MKPMSLLHTWPLAYRVLIAVFVGVTLVGVVFGAVFIEATTHLTPTGVTAQYRGLDEEAMESVPEMKFPKTTAEMLMTTHNHILGLSVLFLIYGFLYLHTVPMSRRRLIIAVEPLIGLVTTFGGLWIVRFLWPPFVYVVILSGALMLGTTAWMGFRILVVCARWGLEKEGETRT